MDNEDQSLNDEDRKLSQRATELLEGDKVVRLRWTTSKRELYIEFESEKKLFVDNIKDKEDRKN